MQITEARGAIAITLDRPRTLFFPMEATFALVRKYGVDFLSELYSIKGKGPNAKLDLNDPEALRYFLWLGLQEEISDMDETLSEEDVRKFVRPWTISTIFNALVLALTGAMSTPKLPPGKSVAAGEQASPPADPEPSARVSTLTKGRDLSAGH